MSKKLVRGFTLIELLVVIAIIGILSSVVLASLNTARTKGSDAAVKSNLSGIRAQAEILYDTWGGYGVDATPSAFAVGACAATVDTMFIDPTITNQITAAASAGTGGAIGNASCVSTAAAWAVSVPLRTVPTNSWCVDNKGTSKSVTPAAGDRGFNGVACK